MLNSLEVDPPYGLITKSGRLPMLLFTLSCAKMSIADWAGSNRLYCDGFIPVNKLSSGFLDASISPIGKPNEFVGLYWTGS